MLLGVSALLRLAAAPGFGGEGEPGVGSDVIGHRDPGCEGRDWRGGRFLSWRRADGGGVEGGFFLGDGRGRPVRFSRSAGAKPFGFIDIRRHWGRGGLIPGRSGTAIRDKAFDGDDYREGLDLSGKAAAGNFRADGGDFPERVRTWSRVTMKGRGSVVSCETDCCMGA